MSSALAGILLAADPQIHIDKRRRCSEALSAAQAVLAALKPELDPWMDLKSRISSVERLFQDYNSSLDSVGNILLGPDRAIDPDREYCIAELLLRSRNTALIRAMLLAAQPDLVLPADSGEQASMHPLLLAAFTRMSDEQESWVQAVIHAGFDASELIAAGVSIHALNRAGFSAAQVKATGCDLASAQAAGYNAHSLLIAYGHDAVVAAGCDVSNYVLVSFVPCSYTHAQTEFSTPCCPSSTFLPD
jgi:hypothetical protein